MMRNSILPLFFITLIAIGVLTLIRNLRSRTTVTTDNKKFYTLEEKLEILADCGFKLTAPFTPESLLESWNREAFEQPGFDPVLVGLGMTEEHEPWRNHCANLWHFDSECIEEHGDYKQIAERMVDMTQGALILENIEDCVDAVEGIAWLSCTFRGQQFKRDLAVNDDWVDWHVFDIFTEVLEMTGSGDFYVCYNLGGQDCIVGCVSQGTFGKLIAYGIDFRPLKSLA